MASTRKSTESKPPWVAIVAAIVIVLSLGYLFWPASKVTLDDDGYQVTMALYRICNQRDVEGLAKIEKTIVSPESMQSLSQESQALITQVRSLAKSGKWTDAAKLCRQAMDDQVRR